MSEKKRRDLSEIYANIFRKKVFETLGKDNALVYGEVAMYANMEFKNHEKNIEGAEKLKRTFGCGRVVDRGLISFFVRMEEFEKLYLEPNNIPHLWSQLPEEEAYHE